MTKRASASTTVPRLPVDSGEFDGLMRDLLERMQEVAQLARSTMGTVTAVQGGELVVHIDGERISRTVGFPRKKGVKYAVDDRVKLSLLRNDEYVVDGLVGSETTDRSVDREQIAGSAVGTSEIAQHSIWFIHLEPGLAGVISGALQDIPNNSVGTPQLKNLSVTWNKMAADAVDYSELRHAGVGSFGVDVTDLINYAKGKGWIRR